MDRVDKVGARLPATVVPAVSTLRGSKGYCKLLKGEFSDYQRKGTLENDRNVKTIGIFIYCNNKKVTKRAGKFQSHHVLICVIKKLLPGQPVQLSCSFREKPY